MFLIRAAFWLSLVVLLLPADPRTGEAPPSVSAIEALAAARTAVADISAFCDRNGEVCATGSTAFQVFAHKVRYGVHILRDYFDDVPEDGPDTLQRDDVETPWHGFDEGAGEDRSV